MLRRVYGPKRDEVTGARRKIRNGKLYDLYWSLNIIRAMESRRMRWTGHVANMGGREGISIRRFGLKT